MNGLNLAIVAVTWLMMLAVGMSLDGPGLAVLRRRPGLLAATLAGQTLVVPLVALAIARALSLPPVLALSLTLLAACPVGDIVGFYTLVARGSVPLALALNTASCALAPLSMSLVFAGLPSVAGDAWPLSAPGWSFALRVLLLSLLPIALGFALQWFSPSIARRLIGPAARLAAIGLVATLVWVLVRQRDSLAHVWMSALPAVLAFLAATTAVGLAWAQLWRLPASQGLPVAATFPVRNVPIATALITAFGHADALSLLVLYFLVEVPLFLAAARVCATFAPPAPACGPPRDSTAR